jgi:hypothetical protein
MKRFARWFVISVGAGVSIAVALYILGSVLAPLAHRFINPYVMFALAPAMILGLAEPTSIGSTLLLLGIVLGTNFVLYGLLGLLHLRGIVLASAQHYNSHRAAEMSFFF